MLSTLSTSTRRRGLRGASRKASREQLPRTPASADSAVYSVSSRASSSSSLASNSTISKMSLATSQTSFSMASSAPPAVEDKSPYSAPASLLAPSSPLSPIEVFKLRLATGMAHSRKDSGSGSSGPTTGVRVVGRGGQGSRPRAVPVAEPAAYPLPLANPVAPVPPRNVRRSASTLSGKSDQPVATRMVGRGGVGSKPRGLAATSFDSMPQWVEPPPPPPLPTPQPAAMIQETPSAPIVYRPGGRGGAGSRPRKVKPQALGVEKEGKDFKLPWKGKGKARADAPPAMDPLTRTETRDSTISAMSSIQFAPPSEALHQKPINPDPFSAFGSDHSHSPTASLSSFQSTSSDGRFVRQQSKLSRTLGADFGFSGLGQHAPKALKLARRASLRGPAAPPPPMPIPDHSRGARHQSSYGSISGSVRPSESDSLGFHREVWDADDYRPAPYSRAGTPYAFARPDTAQTEYPAPPRPPQAFPDEPATEDDVSEVLTFDDDVSASTDAFDDAAGPRFSFRSHSSGEIHVQPRFSLSDSTDADEYEYDRTAAQTPTPFGRAETPLEDEKPFDPLTDSERFESPFQTMPLFVVSPWDPKPRPADEWTGEWNRTDMQSVIQSLRQLRA
ncbi:hypothetical protein FB451DRAFT_1240164 [Mycena latifolia]|nr:hypothetical protein FB451DRAFT_1240164 [Mycena latifolia]